MFPVWNKRNDLINKEKVLGLKLGDFQKAYQLSALRELRIINDMVGETDVVLIASSYSDSARAYEGRGTDFSISLEQEKPGIIPDNLVDLEGVDSQKDLFHKFEAGIMSVLDSFQAQGSVPSR